MTDIVRIDSNQRMSRVVKAGGLVFVAGQTAVDRTADVRGQTQEVLAKLDTYLEKAGVDRSRLVSAQIWLANIDRDFDAMNEVWDAWVPAGCAPARATVESRLAKPDILVEIAAVALA